jgi:hypothetical protein
MIEKMIAHHELYRLTPICEMVFRPDNTTPMKAFIGMLCFMVSAAVDAVVD